MAYGFNYTLPTFTGAHSGFVVPLKTADFPAAAIDGGGTSILNGGGNLFAYTSSAKTTRLPVHIIAFVAGGTPHAEVYVRIPSASTGANIYIEADAVATEQPAVTDAYGRNAVWSGRLLRIEQSQLGAQGDSTGNNNWLTENGTPVLDNDHYGGSAAIRYDGTSDYYSRIPSPRGDGSFVEIIVFKADPTASDMWLADDGVSTNGGFQTLVKADGSILTRVDDSGANGGTFSTGTGYDDGTYHILHTVVDKSGSATHYIDGAQNGASLDISGYGDISASGDFYLGAGISSAKYKGAIASYEIYQGVLADTANWIATEADARMASGAWGTVGAWSEGGGGDTTPPVLSNPTGTATGDTTADGSVDTDEGNDTLYAVVTTSATSPSVAQVQAGQDHTGAAAAYATSQSVSGTGTQNVSATGLSPSTAYYWHYQQQDGAANDSTVVTSAQFTTNASADTTPDAYSFTDQTDVALSTLATSDTITVTGIDASTPISITGGEYSINGGAYTSSPGNVVVNDQITLRVTSSSSYYTAVNVALDIGGVQDTWTVLTAPVVSSGAYNNTNTVWSTQAVVWSWLPNGRIGSLTGVTPVEGTGTTDANGQLTINQPLTPPAILMMAVEVTDPTDDNVYYEAFS